MNPASASYPTHPELPVTVFGREITRSQAALEREWLVTNGLGGYASATLSGALTRRYHGLLIAALHPPLQRTLLLARLDETARYLDESYDIFTNCWNDLLIEPKGHFLTERFFLTGSVPSWDYRLADAVLRKTIWMPHGHNTTCIRYALVEGSAPLQLAIKVIVNFRSHHATSQRTDRDFDIEIGVRSIEIKPDGGSPFRLLTSRAEITPVDQWLRDYYYQVEARRGLEALDDHYNCALVTFTLDPGQETYLVATAEKDGPGEPGQLLVDRLDYEADLLKRGEKIWKIPKGSSPSAYEDPANLAKRLKQLVLAADQFVVARTIPSQPQGSSVIAGYPWFSDWGRDTMISLPGLSLATGRPEIARRIILTFAHFIDRGMLPNRFPSADDQPEYNTVDATLWYFYAIHTYLQVTNDLELLELVYPGLSGILDWHFSGTRYNIRVDPRDGLLAAGQPGVQLTWMDAKVDDWVVTPRIGKPVEINALWYNALNFMVDFAHRLGQPGQRYREAARRTGQSFKKYWVEPMGYLSDVIDGPSGRDNRLRPNQLLAVSLPHSPLSKKQQQSIVRICARELYTGQGLRSLSPDDPGYIGIYGGNQKQRDAAYHQGAVWGWLIGPFVAAWRRAFDDPIGARKRLHPFLEQLDDHCLGSLSEIFEGNPPFVPRGCFAQAWSVAEVLWSWYILQGD